MMSSSCVLADCSWVSNCPGFSWDGVRKKANSEEFY